MAPRAHTTLFDPTDPAHMTVEERVQELAAILAARFLRLRGAMALPQLVTVQERGRTCEQRLRRSASRSSRSAATS